MEWSLVQWPTRPLPYGPRRPLMKINKNLHYSCQNRNSATLDADSTIESASKVKTFVASSQ